METDIYYSLFVAAIVTFLIQFLFALLGHDSDLDSIDGNLDFGSLVSFKGVIHFCLGFSGYMSVIQAPYKVVDYMIALFIGIVFLFILYAIYYYTAKLKQTNTPEKGQELVGRTGTVYYKLDANNYMVMISINGAVKELQVISRNQSDLKINQTVSIIDYAQGIYYI